MQRTHEGMAPRGVGMIALARNPLRLTHMPRGGVDDDGKVEKRPPQRPGGSMLRRME
jgi:hypothetical protein